MGVEVTWYFSHHPRGESICMSWDVKFDLRRDENFEAVAAKEQILIEAIQKFIVGCE